MKTVLFDFDRTLIDTDALKREQAKRVAQILGENIDTVEELMKAYIESLDSHLDFDITEYATFIHHRYHIPVEYIRNVYVNNPTYIRNFVYPEVIETLKILRQRGYVLGILSQASMESQRIKFEYSGVLSFMSPAYVSVVRRKTTEKALSIIDLGAMFVDDDWEVIEYVIRMRPDIRAVYIDRSNGNRCDYPLRITSLDKIIELSP